MRPEEIIVALVRILEEVESLDLVQSRLDRYKARDVDLRIVSARALAQSQVCGERIDRLHALRSMKRPIQPEAGGIDDLRIEDVSFFQGNIGSSRCVANQNVVAGIRLGSGRGVVLITSEDAVLVGKLVIQPGRAKVFRGDMRRSERVCAYDLRCR